MRDLSLHILDIAENAVRAKADKIIIEVAEDEANDRLIVNIEDNGAGMDEETLQNALDPFFTTKNGKKTGLGLALFAAAARQAEGSLKIESKKGIGTKVNVVFKLSHPDTKPLGNILGTMGALVAGAPAVRFIYNYKKGDYEYHFDSLKSENLK